MEKYPLAQVEEIKKKRLEEAERALKAKKEALKKEEEKLEALKEELSQSKAHYDDKIAQMREELDRGTTSDKLEQMKAYLKTVEDDMKIKKKKVVEQEKVVKSAEEAVELARQEMLQKQQDVEKLAIHKKEWSAEMRKEEKRKEAIESDEIGSAGHARKKREGQ